VGRYFGREPRYSQAEAEAQAKAAIDAAVSRGRPPDEEWKGLAGRMGDVSRELAARPPVEAIPPPPPLRPAAPGGAPRPRRPMNEILRPRPVPEPEPAPPPAAKATRAPRAASTAAKAAPAKRATPAAKTAAKRTARTTEPPAPVKKRQKKAPS
jgi:hypothetical protein